MKLIKCKRWLTIKDASKILAFIINEKVRQRDIYRLAIDEKLVLSLLLVNDTYVNVANHSMHCHSKQVVFTDNYKLIKGGTAIDLTNADNCKLILKQEFYKHACSHHQIPLKLKDEQGIICTLNDDITHCRIISYSEDSNKELSNVNVSHDLPPDIIIVIKTEYLLKFANSLKKDQQTELNKLAELENRERTIAFRLLALLALELGLPLDKPYKTADIIINQIAPKLGITPPSRDTIGKYLKEAKQAIA